MARVPILDTSSLATPVAIQLSSYTYAADAQASDAYAIALTPVVASYVTGQQFTFKANTANTGSASLNVNGLGAKTIKKFHDQDLETGDVEVGSILLVEYDGINFQLLSASAAAPITKAQNDLTKEPTGFTDPSAVIITYDSTAKTITLTGTVVAYYRGVDISIANPTFTTGWVSDPHPSTTGHSYFLYYNGTAFAWSDNTFPGYEVVLICDVNYGATNKYAIRECHGMMPHLAHKEFHETIGTYKTAGGTFPTNQYVIGSTTAGDRRPDIVQTTITDEDCPTVLPALTSKAYSIYNLTGAAIGAYTLSAGDIIPLLAANPYYNSFSTPNWGQTLMPANSVATVWVYGIPVSASAGSQAYRYLFIQPQWITQATSGSAGNMTIATNTEALRLPSELNLGTLTQETPEIVCLGKIIVGFTTDWTLRAVTVLTGNKFSQIGSPSGNFLSTVVTDTTLTGAGTGASPLSVVAQVEDSIVDGHTTVAPSGNAVFDALAGKLPIAGGTMTGKTVTAGTTEVAKTYAPSSGSQTVTIDCAVNNHHEVTGNASGTAITFAIQNATNSQVFSISILQGASTLSTIAAWFATVRWAGGAAPTLTATANKRDTFVFKRTGANTYDGFVVGQNA